MSKKITIDMGQPADTVRVSGLVGALRETAEHLGNIANYHIKGHRIGIAKKYERRKKAVEAAVKHMENAPTDKLSHTAPTQ